MPHSPSQAVSSGAPKPTHFHWVDWLRCLAALAVLACHARGGHWLDYGSLEGSSKTALGTLFFAATRPNLEPVVVFFVLSGFLVGGKLIERVMTKSFCARSYAVDRFSRVYLPLVPALFLSGSTGLLTHYPISPEQVFGNLFSVQGWLVVPLGGNAPLWSLTYEVWFYVLGGSAAVLVASARGGQSVWALCGVVISLIVFAHLNAVLLYCWIIGGVAYSLLRVRLHWGIVASGFGLVVVGAVLSQLNMESQTLVRDYRSFLPSRNVCVLVMSAGLCVVIPWMAGLHPVWAPLRWLDNLGTKLAAPSYTIYLTHYPLLQIWELFDNERRSSLDLMSFWIFGLKLGYCMLVGWVMYRLFEARTLRFRRWLRARVV